jgi:hypothetical protein
LPEALARADYDYTVSEDPPPRRRQRARVSERVEPTVSRVPAMREGGALARSSAPVRYLRALIRRPLRTLVSLACAAIAVSFVSNLLFMQKGPHPAPLFVKQDAKPAEASGATNVRQASAVQQAPDAPPRAPANVPASRPVETQTPMPPSAPRSAPISIVVPPAKPVEQAKPVKQPDFDPIAQFLRSGVLPAPTTTASTGGSPSTDSKRVAAAQRALAKLGQKLDADGVMGPGTRGAIQRFERENNLPVTGELNPRTLKALSARASIPIP